MAVRVINNSREIQQILARNLVDALNSIGFYVTGEAKDIVPKDTGRLRASIEHEIEPDRARVHIGSQVEYADYVEMGTYKQRSQPYLRPAAYDHIPEILRKAEFHLKKSL